MEWGCRRSCGSPIDLPFGHELRCRACGKAQSRLRNKSFIAPQDNVEGFFSFTPLTTQGKSD